MRARCSAASAQEHYWRDPQGEAATLNREAVEIARRLGDDRTLAHGAGRARLPDVSRRGRRRAASPRTRRCCELARAGRRPRARGPRARVPLLRDLLELGDVAGADAELDAYARLAEELRQPQHLWHVPLLRAMRAMMDGRFDEAERLAEEAPRGGERAQEPLRAAVLRAADCRCCAAIQGRARGDAADGSARWRERYPAIRAWRLALVSFLAELGPRSTRRGSSSSASPRATSRTSRSTPSGWPR